MNRRRKAKAQSEEAPDAHPTGAAAGTRAATGLGSTIDQDVVVPDTIPELSLPENQDNDRGNGLPIAFQLQAVADALHTGLETLGQKIDQLADRDERENRMYQDLRKLREGDDIVRSLPLFRSVIQLIDRVHEIRRGGHDLAGALSQIEEELVELLERYGIEQIRRDAAEGFDAGTQKAIGQLDPTSPEDLRIVAPGYSYGDRIIRHQHVMMKPVGRSDVIEALRGQ